MTIYGRLHFGKASFLSCWYIETPWFYHTWAKHCYFVSQTSKESQKNNWKILALYFGLINRFLMVFPNMAKKIQNIDIFVTNCGNLGTNTVIYRRQTRVNWSIEDVGGNRYGDTHKRQMTSPLFDSKQHAQVFWQNILSFHGPLNMASEHLCRIYSTCDFLWIHVLKSTKAKPSPVLFRPPQHGCIIIHMHSCSGDKAKLLFLGPATWLLHFWVIYGYPTRDVGNPYIVYGISVNKLIYREQRDDKLYPCMVHSTCDLLRIHIQDQTQYQASK